MARAAATEGVVFGGKTSDKDNLYKGSTRLFESCRALMYDSINSEWQMLLFFMSIYGSKGFCAD